MTYLRFPNIDWGRDWTAFIGRDAAVEGRIRTAGKSFHWA